MIKEILFAANNQSKALHHPYFLLLPPKIGSEYWLVAKLGNQIATFPFRGIIRIKDQKTETLPENADFVIIDDALYSGFHQLALLDNLAYNRSQKESTNEKQSTQNIHFVVPYVTKHAENVLRKSLRDEYKNIYFYLVFQIHTLNELIQCQANVLKQLHSITRIENVEQPFFSKMQCPTIEIGQEI